MNKTHRFRQFLLFDRKAGTRVNKNLILFNDAFGLIPTSKTFPIIGTDNEIKLAIGIRLTQFLQVYIRYMKGEANETQNLKPENEDSH